MTEDERREIADYEREISLSTPYDKLDEELARFYPQLSNGHPDICMCRKCAPGEYINYDEEEQPATAPPTRRITVKLDDLSPAPYHATRPEHKSYLWDREWLTFDEEEAATIAGEEWCEDCTEYHAPGVHAQPSDHPF